ncbi:hypothetical protein K431DRAFT_304511 [Polychaeton citri CBS 116435]|uniref:Uncharacterized protein n=1 Tax=Polychaeton citri CBS 116435 TaxID=1314669 RepID=A0A9P4UNU4_9PEZI|nr:hypothetical protein K431DRAFT_304511 [Polychaeton citri CBS 116435]
MAAIYNYFYPPVKPQPKSPQDIAHDTALREHMREMLDLKDKKFCPSEVAAMLTDAEIQNLGHGTWEDIMPGVMVLVGEMQAFGEVDVFVREDAEAKGRGLRTKQGGEPKGKFTQAWDEDVLGRVATWKGPLRLRRVGY